MSYQDYQQEAARFGFTETPLTEQQYAVLERLGLEEQAYEIGCDQAAEACPFTESVWDACAELPLPTPQEQRQWLFEVSLKFLRKQGKPSATYSEGGGLTECVYQSEDGCGCAARPFIVEYDPYMEGRAWEDVVDLLDEEDDNERPFSRRVVVPQAIAHEEFVKALQNMHDGAARRSKNGLEFTVDLERSAFEVANKWNLRYPEPT